MTYYSVLAVTPNTDAWIPDYVPVANKLVTKHGGQYLARTANHEQIEGIENSATLRVIIEWPSKQAAVDFMNDPDYAVQLEDCGECDPGPVIHHHHKLRPVGLF